jgi:hypothetical protein
VGFGMDGRCVWGEVSLEAIACGLLLWLDWWVLCVEAVGELKLTFLFFPLGFMWELVGRGSEAGAHFAL